MLCWCRVICVALFFFWWGGVWGGVFVNVLLLFDLRKEFGMS